MRKTRRGSIKPTRTIETKAMTEENTTTVPETVVNESVVDETTTTESTDTAADLAPLDAPVEETAAPEIIATDAVVSESETPAPAIIETEAPVVLKEEQTITAADVGVAPAEVAPAPVAEPVAEVTTPAVVITTPEATGDLAPLDVVHPVTTHIRNLLDSYYEEMRPGYPTSADKGKFKQRHLEAVYKQVLARTEGEFDIAMDALLAYVDEHRNGVFAEGYVFRFMTAAWPTAQNRAFFETFTALILRIHDPKSRGIVLRQSINYINVLKKLLKPEEAERLQGFIEKYL